MRSNEYLLDPIMPIFCIAAGFYLLFLAHLAKKRAVRERAVAADPNRYFMRRSLARYYVNNGPWHAMHHRLGAFLSFVVGAIWALFQIGTFLTGT